MNPIPHIDDLLAIKAVLWPDVRFYDRQIEVIESHCDNVETDVPAGNKLGKDFVTGFIVLADFLWCLYNEVTCRIVTTSVAEHHLKVLWGEVGRFVITSSQPLLAREGGPLVMNYQEIRRSTEAEAKNPLNYLVGRVSAKGEGMSGHHAEFTLMVGDEASGLDDDVYLMGQGWAKRFLFIGNPNNCENFWRKGIEAGDLEIGEKVVA